MKKTKLTAGSNLLWEGSRMMLPEHKEAIITQYNQHAIKEEPSLDEQKLDEISSIIRDSYYNEAVIQLVMFDEYDDKKLIGVVTQLDMSFKYIKFLHEENEVKINCRLITDAFYERETNLEV